MDDHAATLASTVAAVALAPSPAEAARRLVVGAMALTGATSGRLYLFELGQGTFVSYASVARGANVQTLRVAEFRDHTVDDLPPLERAVVTRQPVVADPGEPPLSVASRLVVPVVRDQTCIGLLDLDADDGGFFDDREHVTRLAPITSLVVPIYERRFLVELLSQAQQPVDVTLHDDEFYDQVLTLVALSSQMEHAVLRELTDEGELVCVGAFGFDGVERERLTLTSLDACPPFAEVIRTQRAHVARDIEASAYDALRAVASEVDAASFVALPVIAGGLVFGVLTLASSAEYDYTPQEVTAFASVAGEVGTVIANHRSFQRSALASTSYAEIGLAITGVEVAQAARHEARGLIDDCVVTMGSLALEARKLSGGRPATNVMARIDDIDATLQDLSRVLDKIKAATRAPRREKALVSLREVWDQARSQLIGKFHGARLESCRYDGPDVMVNVATDWFRQVFINLILNSLEAFAEGGSNKRGRQIRLVVERPGERQRDYVMTYSDNAGGINPSALRHLDGSTVAESVEHAIFQPNVTSKATGSGWGLALVRRILEDHRGTINLVDYRGGVTFRLQIPRPAPSGGRDT